jgi:hypothetical protein
LLLGKWLFDGLKIYLLFGTWPGRTFQFVSEELLVSLNAKVGQVEGLSFDFAEKGTPATAVATQTIACGSSGGATQD